MSTDHALETLCLLCLFAPMTTTITQIHQKLAGAEPIDFIGHTARQYRVRAQRAKNLSLDYLT
jgi:hypothetical protein